MPQFIGEAEAQVRQLEAQVALARAQLDQAALNLSWTKVAAPQDGWVTKRNVEQGNYVQAGQSILSHRHARDLDHRQFQGDPSSTACARASRWISASMPIPT